MQNVKVDKSMLDKRRLKHETELALTTADGKKFQQDTQAIKEIVFIKFIVEHKGRRSLLPPVRVCEEKFDIVKYSLLGRATRSCKHL